MDSLKERLKKHEGFQESPYRDDKGYWTIGYGHFMGNGGCRISPFIADAILVEDLHKARFEYFALGWDHLSPTREDVVIELIFWHGFRGFLKFKKCIAAIERSDWETAADEMMDSQSGRRYATRMKTLADIMRHG